MPGKIIETHIGPAPMRSVPVTPCSSALIRSGDIPLFDHAQEMTKQPRMHDETAFPA
jgi:hypothetical protein